MKTKPALLLCLFILIATIIGLNLGNQKPGNGVASTPAITQGKSAKHETLQAAKSPKDQEGQAAAIVPVDATPMFTSNWQWGKPVLPPITEATAKADIDIIASVLLPKDAFKPISSLHQGQTVSFPVANEVLVGTVNLIQPQSNNGIMAGGSLGTDHRGEFSLRQDTKSNEWGGLILDLKNKVAYTIHSTTTGILLHKKPIDSVQCAMPRPPKPIGLTAQSSTVTAAADPAATTIPLLDSRPSAQGVLYLDFDGETVTDPGWNGGSTIFAAPAVIGGGSTPISASQIQDVWARVAEDYKTFNVSVTTNRKRYDQAPVGQRVLCIITPTDSWYSSSVGGVAKFRGYRGPYAGLSDTVPCWVFNNYTTSDMALTCSHEIGHMVNLSHDGTVSTGLTYYGGHDSGVRSWGPIMGAPWNKNLTQWSKGEYTDANNNEDDFIVAAATISEPVGYVANVADSIGNDRAHAKALTITSPISDSGQIDSASDSDYFSFNSNGGPVTITVTPALVDPNLDVEVEIQDSTGTQLAISTPTASSLAAYASTSLSGPGTYYVAVRGRANPATTLPLVNGYSNYGCVGPFTITGTYTPLPAIPVIITQPISKTALQGSTVSLTAAAISNSKLTYQWYQRISGQPDKLLTGKTSATLTFTGVQPASAGDYFLRCHNTTGDTDSDVVSLTVLFKPVFTLQPLPATQTVQTGSSVTYNVNVNGTAPITLQWKKNGVALPGENGTSLQLGLVDWFDYGSYSVTATNAYGSTNSVPVSLKVTSGPIFTVSPPAKKYIALGGSASAVVKAVGTPTITYEWYQNGNKIASGTTKTAYAWSKIKPEAAGTYYVRAINASGPTDSTTMEVEVQDRPVILTHPIAKATLNADQSFTLSCTASGTDTLATPLVYHWQLNGINIVDGADYSGSNTNTLTLNPVHWHHRGTYRCVVSNAVGTATTKNSVITVISYPVILTQPSSIKIAKNGTGTLKVVAGGTGILKYQWFKDDVLLPKATSSSLVLSKASPLTTNGTYKVTVTTTTGPMPGVATSNTATVQVEDPPVPGLVISSLGRFSVGLGEDVTLSVNAAGSPILTYQWQRNKVDIVGATGSSLDFINPQYANSASYRVRVRNDVGIVYSAAVTLKVIDKPVITKHPVPLSIYEHDTATFTVAASGSPTLTYQWRFNGVNITNNTTARTATLKLTNILAATQTGNYSCVVSNLAGSATSNDASLTINPVPAPTLVDVRPTKVVVGSRIMISGTNLNWATGIKINGKVASLIRSRSNEIFTIVPAGATAGTLSVTTYGGTVSWPTPITLVSGGRENDNFLNAKILAGLPVTSAGDNTYATSEGEYSYGMDHTIWFRWRATLTGKVTISTDDSVIRTENIMYVGPTLANNVYDLTTQHYFWDYHGYYLNDDGNWDYDVIKGNEYYFCIDSAPPTIFSAQYGPVQFSISKVASAEKVTAAATFDASTGYSADKPLDGQQQWQTQGGAVKVSASADSETGLIGSIGGSQGTRTATAAILPTGDAQSSADPVTRATADLSFETKEGTNESFAWSIFDGTGKPAISLIFNSVTGGLLSQIADGDQTSIDQVFTSGPTYAVTLEVDNQEHTWKISLNGISIAEGTDWIAPTSGLASVGASWQPASGTSSNGRMTFNNVVVSTTGPVTTSKADSVSTTQGSSD